MFDDLLDDDDSFIDAPEAEGLKPPRESNLLLGYDALEQTFINDINAGTMPHALILAGPKGIGKATFAYRLARGLLAQEAGGGLFDAEDAPLTSLDIAQDNPVFGRVASGGHPDFLVIEPAFDDKKGTQKTTLDVDTARKVVPFLRMTSSDGGWRVVIIDDADTMNRNAQNAILKILEEPPAKTLLILVCHRPGALIPTIRSRCRFIALPTLSEDTLEALLSRAYPGQSCRLAQSYAAGSMHRAIEAIEQNAEEMLQDIALVLSTRPSWNWPKIHALSDTLARQDAAYQGFTRLYQWVLAQILVCKARAQSLPAPLQTEAFQRLHDDYSLEDLTEICDSTRTHFEDFDRANLDKKQAILGAFTFIQ